MIADNLKSVRQRIAACCERVGRSPEDVELVCVTKEASLDEIEKVIGLGVHILGENRVQDAVLKHGSIEDKTKWHLIGHLQTNKVKDAVKIFSLIHSIDSVRLAKEIDKEARKINKIQDALVQVNTSGEKTKFGIKPEDVDDFLKEVSLYSNINIKGLMAIAPEVGDPEAVRPYFKALRELRDRINAIRPSAGSGLVPSEAEGRFTQDGTFPSKYFSAIVSVRLKRLPRSFASSLL